MSYGDHSSLKSWRGSSQAMQVELTAIRAETDRTNRTKKNDPRALRADVSVEFQGIFMGFLWDKTCRNMMDFMG